MRFHLLTTMLVATMLGCSSPEDTQMVSDSVSSFRRMEPSAKVTDSDSGSATISADNCVVTFFGDGFEYSFDIEKNKSLAQNSMPFIAFRPTNKSILLEKYLECTLDDCHTDCQEFSCQSSSKDGRRTVRLTMHHGD